MLSDNVKKYILYLKKKKVNYLVNIVCLCIKLSQPILPFIAVNPKLPYSLNIVKHMVATSEEQMLQYKRWLIYPM